MKFTCSPRFAEILQHVGASLAFCSPGSDKVGVLYVADSGKINIRFASYSDPASLSVARDSLTVGMSRGLWNLQSAHSFARTQGLTELFLPRQFHFTDDIGLQELVQGVDGPCLVSSRFSCLCHIDEQFSFVPVWRPGFISQISPDDRCHLSGVAMRAGVPVVATAFARSDEPLGWTEQIRDSGLVMDVASGEIVATSLSMPHSPRWQDGAIWVLDSGNGGLLRMDPSGNRDIELITRFPGFTRGLAFTAQFAWVGLSRTTGIRNIEAPVMDTATDLHCGIGVVDLKTGQQVAACQFHDGISDISDIQLLPGMLNPKIAAEPASGNDAVPVWLVPDNRVADSDNGSTEKSKGLIHQALEFHHCGRLQESLAVYRKAVELDPENLHALNGMANLYQDLQQREKAIASYQKAIDIDEGFVPAYQNLGYLLREEGRIDDSQQMLRTAQSLQYNEIIDVIMATSLLPIYQSVEDLNQRRSHLIQSIQNLADNGKRIDIGGQIAPTMFYCAYQGKNDIDLQKQMARIYQAPQPVQPRSENARGQVSERRKIGFISRHFRNHTIGRLNIGVIEHLPRDSFEVHVISVGCHDDWLAERYKNAADVYHGLPTDLVHVRDYVTKLGLDLLFFTDVGMDPLTYTLSFSRMAAIQCVTWGHPTTTGSRAIDYFISSETLEVAEADDHYTEKLIRLPTVNSYYYRPELTVNRDREYFGLSPDRNIYLCFQNLFKFHPDFDAILNGILQRDPLAEIVLMEGRNIYWTELLNQRLKQSLKENFQRIRFLPGQPHEDFLCLNAISDVSLDPIHFGGGNTSYEAFAAGLPVVTLPSEFLRCRITSALYQQMQWTDCIADSADHYVDIAVHIGANTANRDKASREILERCPVLFEDRKVIEGLATFFNTLF